MPAVEARKPAAAGRKWLRSYFNGCAFKVFDAALPAGLIRRPFLLVAEWLFRTSGLSLIGADARLRHSIQPGQAVNMEPKVKHVSGVKVV